MNILQENRFSTILHSSNNNVIKNEEIIYLIDELLISESLMHSKAFKQAFNNIKNIFIELNNKYNISLTYKHIDYKFLSFYVQYLNTVKLYQRNTIKLHIDYIKYLCHWLFLKHYLINDNVFSFNITKTSQQFYTIISEDLYYLYSFPIMNLTKLHSQYRRNLIKIRDIFILLCNFGLRISDMLRVDKCNFDVDENNISNNKFNIFLRKTGVHISFKLSDYCMTPDIVKEILDKYDYKCPFIDISEFDKYIKRLFKLLNFNKIVTYYKLDINNNILEYTDYEYNLVTSHTGRRSFISYHFYNGMCLENIQKASGHKKLENILGYIQPSLKVIKERIYTYDNQLYND